MGGITVKGDITFGDIVTAISILLSGIALIVTWQRDQALKQKEYADRIRRGASTVVAKLQRWRDLTLHFFEEIQPLITEADMTLVSRQEVLCVRDTFWRGMVDAHARSSQRITDEQIEIAYVDLFGYDPRVQALFVEVIERLKLVDQSIYTEALISTQSDVLLQQNKEKPFVNSQLGNKLRDTCHSLAEECKRLMNETITPFSDEMIRVIRQADHQIVSGSIRVRPALDLYPTTVKTLQNQLNVRIKAKLAVSARTNVEDLLSQAEMCKPMLIPLELSIFESHHKLFSDEGERLAAKESKSLANQIAEPIQAALGQLRKRSDHRKSKQPRK
jgi:hypothetical protein